MIVSIPDNYTKAASRSKSLPVDQGNMGNEMYYPAGGMVNIKEEP